MASATAAPAGSGGRSRGARGLTKKMSLQDMSQQTCPRGRSTTRARLLELDGQGRRLEGPGVTAARVADAENPGPLGHGWPTKSAKFTPGPLPGFGL